MLDAKLVKNIDKKVGQFRFKKLGNVYLLTNDVGKYVYLSEDEFSNFLEGKLEKGSKIYDHLVEQLFLIEDEEKYKEKLIKIYGDKNRFLQFGPSLHIVVVTLRCNHNCVYCHASAGNVTDKSLDMDMATAKKVVETVFNSNNNAVAIEFQGGEPLLNWDVVRFIVSYAREKNKLEKKDLELRLVSNFSLLDDEKLNFLIDNQVNFCTSLDGDEETHNFNRPFAQGNGFGEATKWIKKINNAYEKKYTGKRKNYFRVGAVITVTKKTFENYKKVVDTYLDLGFRSIYLRYLNPFGFALNAKEKIWYNPKEYLDFYKKTFDYILGKNYQGRLFYDFTAVTYLKKILFQEDINNLDLRSPCGAGIGQLAYNYNGDVFTCDEGRMISRMGDDTFKLGNIMEDDLAKIINNDSCKSVCLASCTDGLPGYNENVYQPYMGVCPVYNYSVYKTIFADYKNNVKRQIDEGILDYLFEKLQNKKNADIFSEWVKKSHTNEKI